MSNYEALRAQKIARNKKLLNELHLGTRGTGIESKPPAKKRRKIERPTQVPVRSSARLSSIENKPSYAEDNGRSPPPKTHIRKDHTRLEPTAKTPKAPQIDEEQLRKGWISWKATGEAPTRDTNGTFHFADYEDFLPNKSPEEMIGEGSFGGSYFRPIYSAYLNITIEEDWRELPASWLEGLNVETYLTNSTYNPEVNKYRVTCGQSIEQWEANGWINHQFDVRGWFQWYCRFFQGRRCADDERQISRWTKCVGETGRWRRTLLKKYQQAGIRSVNDEGLEEAEGVSPAIHQTCLHWAFEVKQDVLDDWWDR
jgi:hypothetical protein